MNLREPMDMTELDIAIRNSLRAKMYNARPAPRVRETILRRAAERQRGLWFSAMAPAKPSLAWSPAVPSSDSQLYMTVPSLYKIMGFLRQIL
jgi:hypothetical protein